MIKKINRGAVITMAIALSCITCVANAQTNSLLRAGTKVVRLKGFIVKSVYAGEGQASQPEVHERLSGDDLPDIHYWRDTDGQIVLHMRGTASRLVTTSTGDVVIGSSPQGKSDKANVGGVNGTISRLIVGGGDSADPEAMRERAAMSKQDSIARSQKATGVEILKKDSAPVMQPALQREGACGSHAGTPMKCSYFRSDGCAFVLGPNDRIQADRIVIDGVDFGGGIIAGAEPPSPSPSK